MPHSIKIGTVTKLRCNGLFKCRFIYSYYITKQLVLSISALQKI